MNELPRNTFQSNAERDKLKETFKAICVWLNEASRLFSTTLLAISELYHQGGVLSTKKGILNTF